MRKKPPRQSSNPKEKSFHLEFKNQAQKLAWTEFQQNEVLFLMGPAGSGKAQPLSSKVFTPFGPKTMGEIKTGDEVSTADGKISTVLQVYPQGMKEIYCITFDDGDEVECCADHLWEVESIKGDFEPKIITTRDIIDHYSNNLDEKEKLGIRTPNAIQMQERDVFVDPYAMGLLLANGRFRENNIAFVTSNSTLAVKLFGSLKYGYSLKQKDLNYTVAKAKLSDNSNEYIEYAKELGLFELKSKDKFIPADYLWNSAENRWKLFQGLMDSRGKVNKRGDGLSFSTTSERLAKDVKCLVESLGGLCIIKNKVTTYTSKSGKEVKRSFYCSIALKSPEMAFQLERKREIANFKSKQKVRRVINKIEPAGYKEAKCISLSDCKLYVTDNCIVTHNTFLSMAFAINEILAKRKSKIIITRPVVEAGESIGFLPGDANEKLAPFTLPLFDCISKLVGHQGSLRELVNKSIEVAPLGFMRGRTLNDAVCVFDEAQNASYSQLKLYLTRIGDDSKMIITGDPLQSDIPGPVALSKVSERLYGEQGFGFVNFKNEHIVRSPIIAKILEKL